MTQTLASRPSWSSRWVFILAASGSAVGLGNIWKFPYMVGQNGGAAFVLAYLVCIFLVAMPVFIAEVMLGRRGQANPVATMRHLAAESHSSSRWQIVACMALLSCFIILSFYSVVAGWILSFIWQTALGDLMQMPVSHVEQQFSTLISDPVTLVFWHSIFMLLTIFIVAKGVRAGIGKASQFLMPALVLMLLCLLVYGALYADFSAAVDYMFAFDASKLSAGVVVTAIGHAFFTLSLGFGTIMVYGSYLPSSTSIMRLSLWVVLIDTLVALLAGMVIFPLVFKFDLAAGAGPGLIFQTLPIVFSQMSNGVFWGSLFFLLLLFAAVTSSISMLEPMVAWLSESCHISRIKSAMIIGGAAWLLGIVTALSFSDWAFSFEFLGMKKDAGFFDIFDLLTSSILLPLDGALLAIFAGWILHEKISRQELVPMSAVAGETYYRSWRFLVRYVSPIAILIVLCYQLISPLLAA